MPIEAGDFYIMHMGYIDYHRLIAFNNPVAFSSLGTKKTWPLIGFQSSR